MPHSLAVFKMNLMASVLAGVFDFSCFGQTETFGRGFMSLHFSFAHFYINPFFKINFILNFKLQTKHGPQTNFVRERIFFV